jgi:outer membrane lipoprotein carrier protein
MPTLVALVIAGALSPGSLSASDVARRVEERQRTVSDLQARFVQTYRSGLLGKEIVERGTLALKPPGRMRWEYKDPEPKTFVSDGKTFYFYVPKDHQVIVRDQADTRGVTASLLAGQLQILVHFQAAWESSEGQTRLRLTPRKRDPEIDRVYLRVDDLFRVRAIEILDPQGSQSRFEFDGIRENVGLPDRLFQFEVPRGVEVVSG